MRTNLKMRVKILIAGKGRPVRFASQKFGVLYGKPGQEFFETVDKKVVSKDDQAKYLPESLVIINVSKQFPDEL
ncbi:MAG TPA: hypothetical protein VMV77_03470 [Bacteroidales bacterium]|nr:hypothetical protein [Bacteroidales bacterium]